MSLDHHHATAVRYVPLVRARWGRVTAYRLGFIVGEEGMGHIYDAPYAEEHSAKLFEEGVMYGADHRRKRLQKEKAE